MTAPDSAKRYRMPKLCAEVLALYEELRVVIENHYMDSEGEGLDSDQVNELASIRDALRQFVGPVQ